jgi:3alpha(or 20beta)-hydroxysteroid dehydrogenase
MTGRLDGAVALVTGGASGLGEAQCRLYAEEGATVVVADLDNERAAKLVADLGAPSRFVALDVTEEASWSAAVEFVLGEFGRVDVLVNNAGVHSMSPIVHTTLEDYLAVIKVNQIGVFLGMRAVIPAMTAAGRGSIINVSSVEGLRGTPTQVAYAASKFAVTGMTKVAALELAKTGVRVNSMHPGAIETPMKDAFAETGLDIDALIAKLIPYGRAAKAIEIAQLSLFLASAESSYCSGAEFVADGALTAGIFNGIGG